MDMRSGRLVKRIWGGCAAGLLLTAWMVQAGESTYPTNYTFESDAPGTVYVNAAGQGIGGGWGGPAAASDAAVVVAQSYSYSGVYPVPDTTHSNVLEISSTISNLFQTPPAVPQTTNVIIDLMVKPGMLSYEPSLGGEEPQLAAYLNTNGHIVVRHSYYYNTSFSQSNTWTELNNTPVGSNEWIRLKFKLDYLTSDNPSRDYNEHYFQVYINDNLMTNRLAYVSTAWDTADPWDSMGGSWFLCADSGSGSTSPFNHPYFTSFEVRGVGMIDDLVIATTESTNAPPTTPYDDWSSDWGVGGKTDDDDHDGVNNWEEYLAGTDPTDPNSFFQIIAQEVVNGTNMIYWTGSTNTPVKTKFMILRSTNLMQGWQIVVSNLTRSASGTNVWADPNTPNQEVPAYYRPALPNSE